MDRGQLQNKGLLSVILLRNAIKLGAELDHDMSPLLATRELAKENASRPHVSGAIRCVPTVAEAALRVGISRYSP